MKNIGLEICDTSGVSLQHCKSHNSKMALCLKKARKVATLNLPTLIRGEKGVGKEYLAQAIHNTRCQGKGRFLKVHCSTIPDSVSIKDLLNLLAVSDKKSYAPQYMGTLFFAEVGSLGPRWQRQLTIAMRSGELAPRYLQQMNLQLISSSSEELAALQQHLDHDLFYLLAEFSLLLPPLREREEDLPDYIDHFLEQSSVKYGKLIRGFRSKKLIQQYIDYPWPGNLAELKNVIQQTVVMAEGEYVEPEDLPPPIADPVKWWGAPALTLKHVMQKHIRYILGFTSGDLAKTAHILDIPDTELQDLLKATGLQ